MNSIATAKYLFLMLLLAFPKIAVADPGQALEDVATPSGEAEKVMVGEIEDVVLVPWTVTLPARIDTGATLSSLDARDLTVRNDVAEFTLGKRYGGLRLRLPVVEWGQVQTSMGIEKRPIVEIRMCLGPKLIRTLATLRDRSQTSYPFLIGRNTLNGRFTVDTSRSRTVAPACPLLKRS